MEQISTISDENANAPLCPRCRRPMVFKRAIPRLGGMPELRTYECKSCAVTDTEAVEL